MSARRVGRARGGKHGYEPRSRIYERQRLVVEMSDQGRTQEAIAATLEISQPAVSKILRRVDTQAAAALGGDLDRRRARQLRRLEHLRREAAQAWEASKKGRTRRRQRQTERGSGDGTTIAEVIRDEQAGDPRLLDELRKIEEAISALCGFDRTLPSMPTTVAAAVCSPEELARRLNALHAQLAPRATPVEPAAAHEDRT